jgi:hypothetical protein
MSLGFFRFAADFTNAPWEVASTRPRVELGSM